ncbi:oxidoreductase [Prauserella marina]|uniref:Uncharacterized OsmC-related protein n=1 Tax=Prauserella marina TaxID=530584 RepID=A0A222VQV5_9PSEU|nr:OsmC family protein [Prauserella marina]ASR36232.1 oxidoreductase [Prauserella marina]PWV76995.1 putative OsmC-like protein [Prauserella marina]SDD01981.1 Uncharacterized OsmC-related protein [Prauserella marina]
MTQSQRSVRIERVSAGRYVAHNERGATIPLGGDDEFSPVELLLAAIGGCTAVDTDVATTRRTEPDSFTITVQGDKISDRDTGNRMEDLTVTFAVRFPEGAAGDAARAMLPRTVALSHDKLCTVSRTVELGTPVRTVIE